MRGPQRCFRVLAASAAALAFWAPFSLVPAPAAAVELGEQTFFLRAPWKLRWRTYNSTVFDRGGEYYVTIEMPEEAGARAPSWANPGGKVRWCRSRPTSTTPPGCFASPSRRRPLLGRP